jgi:UDP-N-acetylmuramoyl-L-alanyl-D-glutamate--2,6-diaminopimelate ligase
MSQTATLHDHARWLGAATPAEADGRRVVTGLADDSRRVQPGDLFFARRGAEVDGARFVAQATMAGAIGVVADRALAADCPVLRVEDIDAALVIAADRFFDAPQAGLSLVAITGTKGKTTTAHVIAGALRAAGLRTAVFGTIQHELGDGTVAPAANTTPGVLELRRLLAAARDAGATAVVMEVSSHALDQGRTRGLSFAVAVFTNLASDHLDYHHTLEAYEAAKRSLFAGLGADASAIGNADDPAWPRMRAATAARTLGFGFGEDAALRADDVRLSLGATHCLLHFPDGDIRTVQTHLVGRHNLLNLMAAVGAAEALGIDRDQALAGAAAVHDIPGRLQRVGDSRELHVFVDYAHTEEALRQVLGFLREVGADPLTCVVGCGGNRDRTKRPRMAAVAAELSDRAFFTSDNPRTEDPERILDDMFEGLEDAALLQKSARVPDRRAAIRRAVIEAPTGATVLVAGKGHERYQIVGKERLPFDDVTEVEAALEQRECTSGPTPGG